MTIPSLLVGSLSSFSLPSGRKHLSLAEQEMAKEAKKAEAKKKKQEEEQAAKAKAAPAVIEDPNKDGMLIEEVVEDAEEPISASGAVKIEEKKPAADGEVSFAQEPFELILLSHDGFHKCM